MPRTLATLALVAGLALALAVERPGRPRAPVAEQRAEVVVRLAAPPLARGGSRQEVARAQRAFERALGRLVPSARVRWRYRLVLDGLAVDLPAREARRLRALPGVREVFPPARYAPMTGPAVDLIGASALWTPGLDNAGEGMKIAIVDGGVDQRHPFFDPAGYTMPPGYPKGQRAFTTAKVIVARTFPAPGQTGKALLPFDADASSAEHGTHVAGIAAGNARTNANGALVSGVAPRAYIGNYRALTVPTDSGVGEDGNAAELVAAIEAAVADGMDVINLSVGEVEIEPSRDAVALALEGAAAAGVVPVAAAGNDLGELGAGAVLSPASAPAAIAVGAVTAGDGGSTPNVMSDFSSEGPTPISLRLKPDVSAPGVGILSSLPSGWGRLSGTSMASPHVAGGVALLLQRHPDWTPAQVKAALVETADPAFTDASQRLLADPLRAGGGVIDLARANRPLVFASPCSVSLGYLHPGDAVSRELALTDAGGGAGLWSASVQRLEAPATVDIAVPPTVTVPGPLPLAVGVQPGTPEGDATGYLVLRREGETRRIPFWFRVTTPQLGPATATLGRPGLYRGDTRGRPSRVSVYRYPRVPGGSGLPASLVGPEQVFRVRIARPVANFGVAIVSRDRGVRVEPRVVAAGDENRLTGVPGLPLVINPYLAGYGGRVLAAGAIRPRPGTYDVVFDSKDAAGAGRFAFRFWVDDVTPPTVRLLTPVVRRGAPLRLRVADAGAGVDPAAVVVRVSGAGALRGTLRGAELRVPTGRLAPGRHRLTVQVSDYQETRNMENVAAILPNTRRLTTAIVVR